jgi:tripartite-type tricarboxylate transporter receptor subunit TctC
MQNKASKNARVAFERLREEMMRRNILCSPALGLGLACGLIAGSACIAAAQEAEPFYKGRSLTIGVPNAPGGGYDVYVRALARYLPQHVPGNPSIIVQNIPAAGGMVMANQLFIIAPKDGTYIGMVRGTVLEEELYKNSQVQFESRKFEWLGNMNSDVDTCLVSPVSNVKTIDDFYKQEVVVGASGVGAQSYSFPIAYQKILGMKFKVIAGYAGTPDRMVAMERGEISGACGITVSTFLSQVSSFAKAGKVVLIAQAGLRKDPRYPDLPNMLDQAKTPEARQMIQVLLAPLTLGRPIAAPPGTPQDRVDVLRKAMTATLTDPEFLAEAKKLRIDIQPMDTEATAKAVGTMFEASPEAVAHLKSIIGD